MAFHKSQSSCNPSQNSADIPRTLASLRAVSGVTPRLPLIISLRRGNETPSLVAKSDCVIANGFRNSSSSISPGWVGARFVGSRVFIVDDMETCRPESLLVLVVVRNLDLICASILPTETNSIPLVDANARLTLSITFQHLQFVARRHRKVIQIKRTIELIQFPLGDSPKALRTSLSSDRRRPSVVHIFGSFIPERFYHASRYTIYRALLQVSSLGRALWPHNIELSTRPESEQPHTDWLRKRV